MASEMKHQEKTKHTLVLVMLGCAAFLLILGAVWLIVFPKDSVVREGITPSELSGGSTYSGAPLAGSYKHEQLRFSISVPEGFSATELPKVETGRSPFGGVEPTTIIIQNEKGDGIQILATPYDTVTTLTAADIQRDIPDLEIREVEEIEIGAVHTGVAFLSDNPAFNGASREVWFVFRGTLYQISTYARLDSLLKAVFATWSFF